MRKLALLMEVPTAHLDDIHPVLDGHFCIASKCLTDAAYFEWFKNRPRDSYLMLDNGTHEERKPVTGQELLDIAMALHPQVVFAPDYLLDYANTWEASKEFYFKCEEKKTDWSIAFIPQGEDLDALCKNYERMACFLMQSKERGWIGMSLMDNREFFIQELLKHYHALAPLPHHMLGLRNLQEIKDWPVQIVSTDTVKPLKAAYHGLRMEDCPRGLGVWSSEWLLTSEQLQLCYRNIGVLQKQLTLGGVECQSSQP